MFKNEKLTKVNERLSELEAKKETLQNEVNEILEVVESSIEAYALGEVEEKDVEKVKALLEAKTKEIEEIEEMIAKVKVVRESVVVETIPFVKEARQKKIEKIQKEYDDKAKEVIEARNEFLRKLAELGTIKNKIGEANNEYNAIMIGMGEKPSIYGSAINEITLISGGYTLEKDCLGVEEIVQKQIYAGNIPSWITE